MDNKNIKTAETSRFVKRVFFVLSLAFVFGLCASAQNVIVVVIDGARRSETLDSGSAYIPHMWNELKPLGTVYTDFQIAATGKTETVPGHATIVTGTWQQVSNDINGVPTQPTVFEYFRQEDGHALSECYDVAGKSKLAAIAFSTFAGYGSNYRASVSAAEIEDDQVYGNLISIMDTDHPKLIVVNFPTVDRAGHSGIRANYLAAITHVDSLVNNLWEKIQSDSYYNPGNTTLFVTNDHGRHDDAHGGFQNHGDGCAGCRNIMLLAVGRGVTPNQVIPNTRYQIDIAPTIADLLDFTALFADGTSLFNVSPPLPVQISSFTAQRVASGRVLLEWNTISELNNFGFEVQKIHDSGDEYVTIPGSFVPGHGTTLIPQHYAFVDQTASPCEHWYRLKQIDLDGTLHFTDPVSVGVTAIGSETIPSTAALYQNFPNPFNPTTRIGYKILTREFIVLKVFDILGREVKVLVSSTQVPGDYEVELDAHDLASGLYSCRLEVGGVFQHRKMLLTR